MDKILCKSGCGYPADMSVGEDNLCRVCVSSLKGPVFPVSLKTLLHPASGRVYTRGSVVPVKFMGGLQEIG